MGRIGLLIAALRGVVRNRRGNVTMILAFAIVPLMVAVGSAVDYSQAARSRNNLATSADAAALAAAKAAQTYMNSNGTSAAAFAAASALAQVAMAQTFAANQASDNYSQNAKATLTMTQDVDGGPIAAVTATGDAPTTFMRIVGISTVGVGATAQAKGAGGTYYQIVFLVDISNSMAIGGTTQDIQKLENDRYIATGKSDGTYTKCAFACHDPDKQRLSYASDHCAAHVADYFCHAYGPFYCPYTSCQRVQTSAFANKRAFARTYGYKLKIDYVNDAVSAFVGQLKPAMDKAPQYFNVAINTFGTSFTQLQPFTNNSTTLQNAAAAIDIEGASPPGTTPTTNYGYTNTAASLQAALASVSNIGDGSSATSRKTFFIFISDGAQDVWANSWPYYRKVDVDYLTACNAIKAAGSGSSKPTIFSIDVSYYPLPNDSQYQQFIGTPGLAPQLVATMQACASSNANYATYFSASDGPGITAAARQVFSNIFGTGSLHLSR